MSIYFRRMLTSEPREDKQYLNHKTTAPVWRYCSSQESGCLVFTRPNMALPKNNQKLTGSLLLPPQSKSSALTNSVFGLITHNWKQNNSDGDQSLLEDVRDLGCTWFLTEMKSSGYSPFIPLKWQLNAPRQVYCALTPHINRECWHICSPVTTREHYAADHQPNSKAVFMHPYHTIISGTSSVRVHLQVYRNLAHSVVAHFLTLLLNNFLYVAKEIVQWGKLERALWVYSR